ncbi:hypothetical protein Ahy_A03g013029 [Arachis hypogaea]|uniref:Putative plant transposon protein domain-containing protein n=1 Tax=Arachis hypogaea TaxID=3818 RepID=A0A445DUU6_ARAHY|nr:hypothetical protein Ahy_A03g013029 [Arachis hypogaea]
MKRDTLEFVTNLTKMVHALAYQCLTTQVVSITPCKEPKEEQSIEKISENLMKKEESVVVVEQLEKPTVIEIKEEVVQDLRDVEPPCESQQPLEHIKIEEHEKVDQEIDSIMEEFLSTIESLPSRHEVEIVEECAQPPKEEKDGMVHIEIEEYEEVDQETNVFINEFLSKIESPPIGQEIKILEDNTKLNDKGEKVESEETCQEVEATKEEHKEVNLALMSDKGKVVATTSKKRKHSKTSTLSPYTNYAKNSPSETNKENQLLPSTDLEKFPNLYCELRLPRYRKKNLNIENKLVLPNDVRRAINSCILELGLDFVDRDLGNINVSWVKEFYCNFFCSTLDSVQLRGREIMITETAIEEALQCQHLTDGTCTHQQAETAINCMTFDYEALKRVITTPDAPWIMDSGNTKPKGMLFAHLTREAKTWQMIFAHYVLPTTHFSEIPMEMLLLIGSVMESKEVYFPRLIR